jgi:DNA-binding beta-propeller fold protein YncE
VRTLEPPDGFTKVVDVAFDPHGNGWVTEGDAGTIAIFSPDGEFIERWGTPGSSKGQFDFGRAGESDPTGAIAFVPDGGFWITDPGNYRIQRFDADRRWVASLGHFGDGDGQFMGQTYLALDGDGRVYVSDGARGDIQVFSPDGAFERTISVQQDPDPAFRWGLAVAGERLVVPLGPEIPVLTLDGDPIGTITHPAVVDATDVAVGPDGRIYVADWGADGFIHAIDPDAMTVLGTWQVLHDGAAVEPEGLGVAPDGRVWAAQWEIDVVDILELPGLPEADARPGDATIVRAIEAQDAFSIGDGDGHDMRQRMEILELP